jgi:hypothetical protein
MAPDEPRSRHRALAWTAVALIVLGLMVVVFAASRSYVVVEKGRLLDYTQGTVYKVRVFGVELYAENEVKPTLDVLNAALLLIIASVSMLGALLLNRLRGRATRRLQVFLGLAALGSGYLAADELLAIHESLGHNMRFLAGAFGSEQPDGAVQLAYAVPIGAFAWVFRDLFLTSRTVKWLFGVGAGLFAIALLGDGRDLLNTTQEDFIESCASVVLVAGFVVLTMDHIARALQTPAAEAGPDVAAPAEPAEAALTRSP